MSRRGVILVGAMVIVAILVGAATAVVLLQDGSRLPRDPAANGPSPTEEVGAPPDEEQTPSEPPTADCSAAGLSSAPTNQEGLPAEVADMRALIVEAAVACDYERLEELAEADQSDFTYSFGGGSDFARYLRQLERSKRFGEDVMSMLVKTFDLPYCVDEFDEVGKRPTVVYQWPSAHCDGATHEDWQALLPLYSKASIAHAKKSGGFIGYRIGISADGDWRFYVAGD